MIGYFNSANVKKTKFLFPENDYVCFIETVEDKESKNGDPMMRILLRIIEGDYKDKYIYDNILIPKPDSQAIGILGRAIHFLKCIGEPFEGENVLWNSSRWINKKVKVKIRTKLNKFNGENESKVIDYIFDESLIKKISPEDDIPIFDKNLDWDKTENPF